MHGKQVNQSTFLHIISKNINFAKFSMNYSALCLIDTRLSQNAPAPKFNVRLANGNKWEWSKMKLFKWQ